MASNFDGVRDTVLNSINKMKEAQNISGPLTSTPPDMGAVLDAVRAIKKGSTVPLATAKPKNNMLNFQDPTELNSFADVVFNMEALKQRHWLGNEKELPLYALSPAARIVAGAIDVIYTGGIKPLIGDSNNDGKWDWDFGAVALNGLGNFGETMDVAANPVKGAIIEGFNFNGSHEGLTAGDGLKKGWGAGPEGRTQYDYNFKTGKGKVVDWGLNLLAEVLSDPLNYVSFGASTVGKAVGKKVSKEILGEASEVASRGVSRRILDTAAKNIDDARVLVKQTFGEDAAQMFMKAADDGTMDVFVKGLSDDLGVAFTKTPQFRKMVKQAAEDAVHKGTDITEALQISAKKHLTTAFDEDVFKGFGKEAASRSMLTSELADAIPTAIRTVSIDRSQSIIRAMNSMYTMSEDAQKALLKSVVYTTPFGLGLVTGKHLVTKAWAKYFSNMWMVRKLQKQFKHKDFTNTEEVLSANAFLKYLGKTDVGAISDLPDDVMLTAMRFATDSDLAEVLTICAKFKDPRVALEELGNHIAAKYRKSVPDYIMALRNSITDGTLSPEGRTLFEQHATQLIAVVDDMMGRVDAANAAAQLTTYVSDFKAFNTQAEDAVRILQELYRYTAVKPPVDLVDEAVETTRKLFDPRFEKYSRDYSSLQGFEYRNLRAMNSEELQVYAKQIAGTVKAFRAELKPVTDGLRDAAKRMVYNTDLDKIMKGDPQVALGDFLMKLTTVDDAVRADLIKRGIIVALDENPQAAAKGLNVQYTLRAEPNDLWGALAAYQEWPKGTFEKFKAAFAKKDASQTVGALRELQEELQIHTRASLEDIQMPVGDRIDLQNQRQKELGFLFDAIIDDGFTKEFPMLKEVAEDFVGYVAKISQYGAHYKLSSLEDVKQLVTYMSSPKGVQDMEWLLSSATKLESVEAEQLETTIKSVQIHAANQNLQNQAALRLLNNPRLKGATAKPEVLALAYLDAMQTFSRENFKGILEHPEEFLQEVLKRMEARVNGTTIRPLNNLKDVFSRTFELDDPEKVKALNQVIRERFGRDSLTFHDAQDDVIASILLAEKQVGYSGHMFALDLETSESGHILQVAYYVNGEMKNFRVKTAGEFLFEKDDIVRKLSGLGEGHTMAEHKAEYRRLFLDAKDLIEERTAIQTMLQDYHDAMRSDPMMRFVGHNVRDSDELVIRSRARANKIPLGLFADKAHLDKTRIDTYLNEVGKGDHLDFSMAPELRTIFGAEFALYLKQRELEIQTYNLLGRSLYEQTDSRLASNLFNLARDIFPRDPARAMSFNNAALSILEELSAISHANAVAHSWLFSKDGIPELGGILGIPGATNSSQLVGNTDAALSLLSTKIVVDLPTAKLYFDEDFITKNVEAATEFGRKIHRLYQRLGDVETLLGKDMGEVRKLFKHLQSSIPFTGTARNIALRSLKEPSNLKSLVASTLELMWSVRSKTVVPEGATMDVVLHKALDRIADKDIVEMFIKRYPLLESSDIKIGKAQVDIKRALTKSSARIEGELALKAFEDRRNFFDMKEDGVKQWYRFNQKANLVVLDTAINRTQEMWNALSEAAAKDTVENPVIGTALYNAGDSMLRSTAQYLLSLRGTELLAHMQYRAYSLARIDMEDWLNDHTMLESAQKFVAENAETGLIIEWHGKSLIVAAGEDTPLVPRSALTEPPAEHFIMPEELPQAVRDSIASVRAYMFEIKEGLRKLNVIHDKMKIPPHGLQSTGALFSSGSYEGLVATLPDSIKNRLRAPEMAFDMFSFDYSNIASPRLRRVSDPYASHSIAHTYSSTIETFIGYGESTAKARMMLTSESSLNRFSNLFESVTDDAEVLRILKSDRTYRVVFAEKADTPFGYRVSELHANNVEDIKLLRNSEAIIVDHNTHRMLRNILNRGEISSKFVEIFNNVIISPTKAAMLSSLGFLVRNFIDSNAKNLGDLDSPTQVAEYMQHSFEATRWLHIYERDIKSIIEIAGDQIEEIRLLRNADIDSYGPNKTSIDAFFKGYDLLATLSGVKVGKILEMHPDDLRILLGELTPNQLRTLTDAAAERLKRRDMFNLIHTYIAQGPSAGVVMAQQDLIDIALKNKEAREGAKVLWHEKVKRFAWTNGYTRFIMNTQSYIEQAARFSKFTWELKHDKTVAEAMHAVIETHFDYATKSSVMLYLEVVLPFSTFGIANAEYWTRMMSKHGWTFGVLRDMYTANATPSEYSQYEMQNNQSLQYALLNGTLNLSYEGFGFKANPSVLDVMNLLINPYEEIKQRFSKAVALPAELFIALLKNELSFDEALFKKVLMATPALGILAQRYWVSNDWDLKGSAWKAYLRSETAGEEAAVLALPSLFSNTDRTYYFNYPSSNEVWRTTDLETYKTQLEKGALPVITNAQSQEIEARIKQNFYYGAHEYSTYDAAKYQEHLAKGATATPGRPYMFIYGDKEFITYDHEKYLANLAKGAKAGPEQPIVIERGDTTAATREVIEPPKASDLQKLFNTPEYQAYEARVAAEKEARLHPPARVAYKFYYGTKEYETYDPVKYQEYIQNGATAQPEQKKTPVSFHTSTGYTRRSSEKYSSGVTYRSNGMQTHQFGRTFNLSHIAPAIWRRVYSAGGNDRFKVRLTKPTAKNLQYRIRMDWRYWR